MSESLSPLPALDRDALYYPYIHIRDINWLKATLLCFPQVRRIMPAGFLATDNAEVRQFASVKNARGEPLLSYEYTDTSSVESPIRAAQERLLKILKQHEEAIRRKYRPPSGDFRIHTGKVMYELSDYLIQNSLARHTAKPAGYLEDSGNWIALDYRLGEAIMSVIAIAIARHKGLDIVTSSGAVHHALLVLDENELFAQLLGTPRVSSDPSAAEIADELAMVVMTSHFDLHKLSAEHIGELIRNGKDLRAFKTALMPIAESIPGIVDEHEREEKLKHKAVEVIEEWTKYKKSLPKFAFDALLDVSEIKFPDIASAILAGGTGLALASGTGLAIGLLAWKGFQILRKFKEQASGPYSYLSHIQDAGAALVFGTTPKPS